MSILEKTALEQQALNVIDRINAQQISPVIFFDTQQTSEPLPVTASKVGGVPYVPVGTAAPTNGSGQNLGLGRVRLLPKRRREQVPQHSAIAGRWCEEKVLST